MIELWGIKLEVGSGLSNIWKPTCMSHQNLSKQCSPVQNTCGLPRGCPAGMLYSVAWNCTRVPKNSVQISITLPLKYLCEEVWWSQRRWPLWSDNEVQKQKICWHPRAKNQQCISTPRLHKSLQSPKLTQPCWAKDGNQHKKCFCSILQRFVASYCQRKNKKRKWLASIPPHWPPESLHHLYCPAVSFISLLPVITPSAVCCRVKEVRTAPHLWPVGACSGSLGSVSPGARLGSNWWFGGSDGGLLSGLYYGGKIRRTEESPTPVITATSYSVEVSEKPPNQISFNPTWSMWKCITGNDWTWQQMHPYSEMTQHCTFNYWFLLKIRMFFPPVMYLWWFQSWSQIFVLILSIVKLLHHISLLL